LALEFVCEEIFGVHGVIQLFGDVNTTYLRYSKRAIDISDPYHQVSFVGTSVLK
jgi:hypothetical protein